MEKKDKDKDKMRKIAEIEKQIWKVYDILKKEGLGVEDSHLLLLFLSLYKDDKLDEFLDQLDEPNDNQTVGEAAPRYSTQKINHLQVAGPQKQLSGFGKEGISKLYSQINKDDLGETFEGLFESVLQQITNSQGRVGGESMQPDELTRFITNLVDLPKGAKVYNPFAGYGSYALYLDDDCEYFGQELDAKTWALGKIRLEAHNKLDSTTYLCEDSIVNWPNETEKFDLIVSSPPLVMQLNNEQQEVLHSKSHRVEDFLIEKSITSLHEQGKLIALFPQTILVGNKNRQLREELIEKDLVDTIISLPGGLLLNSGFPIAIIVLNKDKEFPGKVRFINANSYVKSTDRREKILDDDKLQNLIQKGYENSNFVRIVDIKQIKTRDYKLDVARYFLNDIEGTTLAYILQHITACKQDITSSGKLIQVKDLKGDNADYKLDLSTIPDSDLSKSNAKQINETCLLLSKAGEKLKPTLFEYNGTPIFISHNILSFKIDETKVLPAYLIHELSKEYIQEQFDAYRLPFALNRILKDDFFKIVVKLPSLEAQKEKVLAEQSDNIEKLLKERNIIAHSEATNQFNEFASLKHTLGRPRANILGWADNINAFLTEHKKEFELLNQEFKEFYGEDVYFALNNIKDEISFITKMLEKGEKGFNIEGHNISFVSLLEIKELINSFSSNGVKFKIKRDLLIDITKKETLKSKGVAANKELFKALIDNLLTNADRYAFDEKSEMNEVIFEVKEVDGFLLIEIRNNGKPFPRNYDREKFITKYSTTNFTKGTGQGGYHIHRIAKKFGNPDWELILNKDPVYPVKFRFKFSIKNN